MTKKQKKPKKSVQPHTKFEGGKKKAKNCPKCGAGYTLAQHNNRLTCGKCGYTEFISKKE
jgi:small subunit ribosomal protein S27Ae